MRRVLEILWSPHLPACSPPKHCKHCKNPLKTSATQIKTHIVPFACTFQANCILNGKIFSHCCFFAAFSFDPTQGFKHETSFICVSHRQSENNSEFLFWLQRDVRMALTYTIWNSARPSKAPASIFSTPILFNCFFSSTFFNACILLTGFEAGPGR